MPGLPVFNLAGTAVLSTTTASVSWPTHATNHVALLIVETNAQSSALVTAAGFVQITNSPVSVGTAAAVSAVAIQVYWKRATGTAESAVTCADSGDHTFARIVTFTNCVTSGNPWELTATHARATASTALSVTAATTVTANCLIVYVVGNGQDSNTTQVSAWTNASLGGLATIAETNSNSGNGGGFSVGAGTLVTPGGTGTATVTLAAASKYAAMTIALMGEGSASGNVNVTLSLSGTSTQTITGTGNVNVALTLSGTGLAGALGTGSAAVAPTLSGTSTQTITGTGTVAVPMSLVLAFAGARRWILDNIVAASSPAAGWNIQKANLSVTDVVRTSDTVVTITLDALSGYDIADNEVLTVTIPAAAITGQALVATPTFEIDAVFTGTGNVDLTFSLSGTGAVTGGATTGTGDVAVALTLAGTASQVITGTGNVSVALTCSGSGLQTYTGTGSVAVALTLSGTATQSHTGTGSVALTFTLSGTGTQFTGITGTGAVDVTFSVSGTSPFAAVRAAIIAGLDSAQAEGTGWDAIVKAGLAVTDVVRTSDTVVTITLPAFASYNITATETITATVPDAAVNGSGDITGAPTFTVATFVDAGAVTVASPSLAGTGLVGVLGTGTVAVPALSLAFGDNMLLPTLALSGAGSVVTPITGTGTVAIAATLAGTATFGTTVTGTGSVAVAPTISGTAVQSHTGTGTVEVSLTCTGTATHLIEATGTVAVPAFSVSGSAVVGVFGSGTVEIIENLLAGLGDNHVPSTHGPGKYRPEHRGAHQSIDDLGSFREDHASAAVDVEEAGV